MRRFDPLNRISQKKSIKHIWFRESGWACSPAEYLVRKIFDQ